MSHHRENNHPKFALDERKRSGASSDERSRRNENLVKEAADILMARCPMITATILAKKLGDLDENHVDVVLRLNSSLAFLVQVKSSNKAVKHHRSLHPDIFAINADKLNAAEISYELERALKKALAEPDKRPEKQPAPL